MDQEPRFAIYFAPPEDSDLWRMGCAWLGRDAVRDTVVQRAEVDGIRAVIAETITVPARHYGFHGTLKAPFALHPDRDEDALFATAAAFVKDQKPFRVRLRVDVLSGFLALRPAEPCSELQDLADDCVGVFDRFRAPLGAGELARRQKIGLTEQQDANLRQWGYPYVFGQYRFHMTLTKKLPSETRDAIRAGLEAYFDPVLIDPVPFDAICLFHQTDRTCPFRLVRRFNFGRAD